MHRGVSLWLGFLVAACGAEEADGGSAGTGDATGTTDTDDNPDGGCTEAPDDAPTADAITSGGSSVICYYGPPEGYCRDIRDPGQAALVEGGDKAAIGCADAIVVTNGTCPTDELVGTCEEWMANEDRYYYTCNQYDELFAGGPEEACGSGSWTPAP
jgi:hypothetical protein